MKEKLQQLGQAMLIPISIITIGSFFMGVGGAFTSEGTISSLGLENIIYEGSLLYNFFMVCKAMGDAVFSNLPIFFAIGVSFGLAKKEKGWAAFSGAVGFLTMHLIISTLFKLNGIAPETTSIEYYTSTGMSQIEAVRYKSLYTSVLGFFSFNMGIFGGLIIGFTTAILHNKFYNIKLPLVLEFFGGTRTVPILTLLSGTAWAIVLYFIWPSIGVVLASFSDFIRNTGLFGTFVWAIADKGLLPLGLHHLITTPLRLTQLGGTMEVCGQIYEGTTNIYMAQLACSDSGKLLVRGFTSGRILLHFGGLVGAALAMYQCADKSKRKAVAGLLIPVVATMILFGVTEPIEFTFLFVAPWLFYLVHVPLTGLAFVVGEMFNISVYGGSIKDMLPTFFQPEKLYLTPLLFLIPIFFAIYYFLFKYLIIKFDIKTPGRDSKGEDDVKLFTKKEFKEKVESSKKREDEPKVEGSVLANKIVEALGGKDNIQNVGNCMTRLRVTVKDESLVVEESKWTNELEAHGVVRKENSIQVIYGTRVPMIAGDVRDLLDEE